MIVGLRLGRLLFSTLLSVSTSLFYQLLRQNKKSLLPLLLSILAELEVEDVVSLLETHRDLYQISFQCLKNQDLNLGLYCTVGNIFRVRLLLEVGANMDSPSYSSGSPLSHAAVNGHEEVVELLLQHGAPIDHNVNSAICPLQAAAKKEYFTIVKLMLIMA